MYKLKKKLYGWKQALGVWYKMVLFVSHNQNTKNAQKAKGEISREKAPKKECLEIKDIKIESISNSQGGFEFEAGGFEFEEGG